jgi:ferredoxin-NADP reductase
VSSVTTWPVFRTKLRNQCEVAERTLGLQFERPSGWTFKAGQFIDVTLINPSQTDAEGNVRGFSIASPPYEDSITIVTRVRDTAFKRTLKAAPLETEVKIEGPFGNLTLHDSPARPAVLLAGGIGITPFRSIVLQATREKSRHRIFLFYSNRRPEDTPFLEELRSLEQQNPNYTFIATMTGMARSNRPWSGETGRINKEMLCRHMKAAASPVYYIAGHPETVHGLQFMLNDLSIEDDDIRLETFVGY